MRAVVCRELSGLDGLVVEDIPTPEPGPGEVRIRVRAAGLNFADTLIIKGQYQDRPPVPFVPGMEVAGRIDVCGAGVAGYAPGDRVMAALTHGGFAEMAVCPVEAVAALPATIDDVTAAGFAVAYGTAYGALSWAARLAAGETLVVHGAAGGVRLATVECGQVLGARVIATARGPDHLAVAREHGAAEIIDTAREDMRARIKELTDGRGADVVFDPIGGEIFQASLRSIAWGGRILVIGFASGEIPQNPGEHFAGQECERDRFLLGQLSHARSGARARGVRGVAPLARRGPNPAAGLRGTTARASAPGVGAPSLAPEQR